MGLMREKMDFRVNYARSLYNFALDKTLGRGKWFRLFGIMDQYHTPLLEAQQANEKIMEWLREGKPRMIARFGSTEAAVTAEAIGVALGVKKRIVCRGLTAIRDSSGFFPNDHESVFRFGMMMKDVAADVDMLGVWTTFMQGYIINHYCRRDTVLTNIHSLDSFMYPEHPWSEALAGKKVLVIHPFADSIREQYKRRQHLFPSPNILPEFELKIIKAVQTLGGLGDKRFATWFDALDFMTEEASAVDFDVALIACGAYGFPLAARIKKMGKISIHLGGVLQVLFGIKGKRWDLNSVSDLYNDYWVRPETFEKPTNAATEKNYW